MSSAGKHACMCSLPLVCNAATPLNPCPLLGRLHACLSYPFTSHICPCIAPCCTMTTLPSCLRSIDCACRRTMPSGSRAVSRRPTARGACKSMALRVPIQLLLL